MIIVACMVLFGNGIARLTDKKEGEIRTKAIAQLHFLGPVFIWCIGFFMILYLLQIDWTTLAAIAAAASLGITISIGELLQNMVGGIANSASDVFREGENLEVDGEVGMVEEQGFLATTLVTVDGVKLIVPNWKLLTQTVKNFTRERGYRIRLRIPIDEFNFDSNQVLNVLNAVATKPKWCAYGRKGFAQFEEIGPSANIFYAYAWIPCRDQLIPKTGQFMKELTDALTAANIGYGETSFIASRFVNVVNSGSARSPMAPPDAMPQDTMPLQADLSSMHRTPHMNGHAFLPLGE
ncbi:MAG: mechanosensitive ion channel family protein [Caldilineaceae bacterium]